MRLLPTRRISNIFATVYVASVPFGAPTMPYIYNFSNCLFCGWVNVSGLRRVSEWECVGWGQIDFILDYLLKAGKEEKKGFMLASECLCRMTVWRKSL